MKRIEVGANHESPKKQGETVLEHEISPLSVLIALHGAALLHVGHMDE